MPHDDGHCIVAQRQQAVADEHRNAHAEVFPDQVRALRPDMPEAVADLFVSQEEMSADEEQFEQPGNQRAQGSPCDFHPRRAEMAEDEHPVKENIDKEGKDGASQRDADLPDASKHNRTGQGQADAEIGGKQPAQIDDAVIHNFLFRGIHAHDHGRGEQRGQGKDHREPDHQAEHDRHRFAEGFQLLHAPVAGCEHGSAHAQSHAEDLKQINELSAQRRSRKLGIPHGTEHHGIHQVDAHRDQLLG